MLADVFRHYMGRQNPVSRGREGNVHFGDRRLGVVGMVSMLPDMMVVANGLALAFQVTKRHAYDAKPAPFNVPGLPPQRAINSRVDFETRGQARSVGHIVFWSDDPDRSMKFYTDRLGFRMTDHVQNKGGVFARAAGSRDHHNLFFIGKPNMTRSFLYLATNLALSTIAARQGMQLYV